MAKMFGKSIPSWRALCVAPLLGLALSACSTDVSVSSLGDVLSSEPSDLPTCPRVSIVKGADRMTRFADAMGRDIIDIVHETQITTVQASCVFDPDGDGGAGILTVELSPEMESERGAANRTGVAEFEYFVTLMNQQNQIVDKIRVPARVALAGNLTRAQWRDEVPISMSLALQDGQSPEDYALFVGLQLSPSEIEYNRNRQKAR